MVSYPPNKGPSAPVSTIVGVVLSLVSAALLVCAAFVFVFYGYCEDACDKPPWAFWPAIGAAAPYALVGIAVMAGACYLFMMRRRSPAPSWLKAVALGLLSSAAFIADLWLFAGPLASLATDSALPLVVGFLMLVPVWIGGTMATARRAARRG